MSELPFSADVEIVLQHASPVHRYEGRPADGPLPASVPESHASIQLRAGLGIVGDRHFGQHAHVQASVTVMNAGVLDRVADELGVPRTLDPLATRRNILLRGIDGSIDGHVDVDALRGAVFSLDTGEGPVVFQAHRPANPCAWMDVVLAPGAHRALRGRGGLRCEPLSDGMLRLGPARLRCSIPVPLVPVPLVPVPLVPVPLVPVPVTGGALRHRPARPGSPPGSPGNAG